MKDSGIAWIGEIPKDWEVCRVKNKFTTVSGATPKTDNNSYWDGDVIWVTPADYKTEDRVISIGRKNLTEEGVNSCGTTIVPDGSIIFSKRAPIGLVAINKVPLCTNQGCISCIPKIDTNSKFYYYLMSVLGEQFELFGSGTTFKEISASSFNNFPFVNPSFSEQVAIAEYLDEKCGEVDELIGLQEKMIEELARYKQSVITEAVTRGLDPNVPLKDSGIEWIGQIPQHWEVSKIKKLFKTISGATPKTDYALYWDGDIVWITPADYKTEDITITAGRRNLTIEGVNSCATTIVPKGSIIFSKRAPIGLVSINNVPLCTNQGCISCIPQNKTITKFYYFLMSILKEQFELFGSGTTFKEISASSFENFNLIHPPIAEQQQIAEHLDQKCREIDELTAIKKQKIEQLKEYKKSIIYEYVTGKKQVSIQ